MAAGSGSGGGVPAELCSQCPQSKDLAVKWKSKSLGRIQTKHLLARYQSGGTAVGWGGRCCRGDTWRGSEGKGRGMRRVKGVLPTQHTLCANPPSHVFEILSAIS